MLALSSLSLYLLLTVSRAQEYDTAPTADYPAEFNSTDDYTGTFDYSFYSNTSKEELDRFRKQFMDPNDEEEEEVNATIATTIATTETTQGTTEMDRVEVHDNTSPSVSVDIRVLIWTLTILISLNLQQLQLTL